MSPRRLPRQHGPLRAGPAATALLGTFLCALSVAPAPVDAGPPPAVGAPAAGTIAVTTTADELDPDDGVTSLREATIEAAAGAERSMIALEPGATYTLTLCDPPKEELVDATWGDLDYLVSGELVIEGHGATITTECVGERLLEVESTTSAVIRDLAFDGGRGTFRGGALSLFQAEEVRLERVTVVNTVTTAEAECDSKCQADSAVFGYAMTTFTMTDSIVADNTATVSGCTLACYAGGGIAIAGTTSIAFERSLVAGNSAVVADTCEDTCGAVNGGARLIGSEIEIDGSSFAFNRGETPDCRDCYATGGIELTAGEQAVLRNSTVTDNTVETGSTAVAGVRHIEGRLTVVHASIVDNRLGDASAGRGTAANLRQETKEETMIDGSVIGSTGSGSGCRLLSGALSGTGNVESGDECGFDDATNALDVGDPHLAPADGAMWVRAPLPGSPAVDVIPAATCLVAVDEVGSRRPVGGGCDAGAIEALGGMSRFVALSPSRLFDSRPGERAPGPKGFVQPGGTVEVTVTGVAGIPVDGVAAVVLNVTATGASGPGYVTVWPSGSRRPLASSINLTAPGQTRANLVTVPVGDGGRISIFASGGTHLLADVAGYYEQVGTPVDAGRLVPLVPARVLDTRPAEPAPGPKGFVRAGETITVQVAGRGLVPARGASAVVLNVTATAAAAPGYVSAWPTGWDRPLASVVNLPAAGDTASNLVMLPLGDDGTIQLSASGGAHLLADVTAYVTGDGSAASTHGLFVPLRPTRVFDTRPGEAAAGPKGFVGPRAIVRTAIGGVGGVPADAAAVALNLTATGVDAPGYITVWPTGVDQPLASTLNVVGGDTRANAAIVRLGAGGRLDHYALSRTHLLADVAGYFVA